MQKIPVYLFEGFLEAGKTKMIQETLEDQNFNTGEKTLVLMCEEGIEELDPSTFWGKNVYIHLIEKKEDMTVALLASLQKQYRIERVMVELNGMWLTNDFYEAMPDGWYIAQSLCFADSDTILAYNANMRQLVFDKISNCEMVIFNRADDKTDKEAIHKLVRAISRRVAIVYESKDGKIEYDEIVDPLPFDVNAPVVTIEDRDYALFYSDICENTDSYEGKTVSFKGIAAKDIRFPANTAALGRHVMTCCANDIQYAPLVCIFDSKPPIKTKDWIIVTGKIKNENNKIYGGKGPVLYVTGYKPATKPEEEIATYY